MTASILKGAVALVSGASSGIGLAIARMVAERGGRVICAARNKERLDAACRTIGTSAFGVELDLDDSVSVSSLLERLPAQLRSVDILVNSAGHDVGGREQFDRMRLDDVLSIIETNLSGALRLTHAVLPGMIERKRGHIVNIGSLGGTRATKNEVAYVSSKFGLHGMSQALRLDLQGTGIRVSEILPVQVKSGFAEARWRDPRKAESFYETFSSILEPEDVARSAIFALEQPSHVNLSQIYVELNS